MALQDTDVKILIAVVCLCLTSCSAFEPGGSFNPLNLRPNGNFNLKAGSSSIFTVVVGTLPNIGISPAAFYRENSNQISLSGSNRTQARLDLAELTGSVLPEDWRLNISGDSIELISSSSSVNTFDTIQTISQIQFGTYRIGGTISVPKTAKIGSYTVQARINLRQATPLILEWSVNVIAP